MGDPRKIKTKFSGPSHPWQKTRIDEERILKKEYGLKNKTEIWRHSSKLKNFAKQAKRLVALHTSQSEKEKKQLLGRLESLGLLQPGATMENVLSLTTKDILERRLQTLVFRKGFARSINQARQFISHAHIVMRGKVMKSPSYLVKIKEEGTLAFLENSKLSKPEHPERAVAEKKSEPETAKKKQKKKPKRPEQKSNPVKNETAKK